MNNLFNELKRRNVFRVGAAYLVVGWLVLQVVDTVAPLLQLPDAFGRGVLLILVIGLPVALVLAWAYELTPEGVKKTEDVDADESITPSTGKKLNRVIAGALVLALAFIAWDKMGPGTEPAPGEQAAPSTVTSASIEPASIAVLPFVDLSPEGDQEYFSDGISEELLNVLAGIDGLHVASRTSSFQFKGREVGIPAIAAELRVRHVLEGSVRKAGATIRVTAQLIDAETDQHLWSDTYDRQLTTENIFAIQDEISRAIVGALSESLGISPAGAERVVTADTQNLDAYELYLEARELFIARGLDNLQRSVELLQRSVELDPAFARAWAQLTAVSAVTSDWLDQNQGYIDIAKNAAERAMALNPDLALTYAGIGTLAQQLSQPDYPAAMTNLQRAIELEPRDGTSRLWYAITLLELGYLDEAENQLRICRRDDPGYINCTNWLQPVLLAQGKTEEALSYTEDILMHSRGIAHPVQFRPLLAAGRRTEAAALGRLQFGFGFPLADFFTALEKEGSPAAEEAWGRVFSWMEREPPELDAGNWPTVVIANHPNPPSSVFENSVGNRGFVWLPHLKAFRQTEDFKNAMRFMGVDKYWRAHGFADKCRPLGDDDFECD